MTKAGNDRQRHQICPQSRAITLQRMALYLASSVLNLSSAIWMTTFEFYGGMPCAYWITGYAGGWGRLFVVVGCSIGVLPELDMVEKSKRNKVH